MLCNECYASGRTCYCEDMEPVCVGNVEDAIERRNLAVQAIAQFFEQSNMTAEPSILNLIHLGDVSAECAGLGS